MAFLLTMHSRLLFTVLLVLGVLVIWGLVAALRGLGPSDAYRAVMAIGELLLLSQTLIGALLWASGRQAARPELHALYGLVAVLALPVAALYMRGREPRSAQLVYALACLFLCGIVLRALETARLP